MGVLRVWIECRSDDDVLSIRRHDKVPLKLAQQNVPFHAGRDVALDNSFGSAIPIPVVDLLAVHRPLRIDAEFPHIDDACDGARSGVDGEDSVPPLQVASRGKECPPIG